MAVPDRKHIGSVAIDAGVDRGLGWSRALAFQHLAVDVDNENFVGRQAGAAGVAGRDQESVGARNTRTDMAAVVEQLGHDHHARAIGDLRPERGFGYLRHRRSGPHIAAHKAAIEHHIDAPEGAQLCDPAPGECRLLPIYGRLARHYRAAQPGWSYGTRARDRISPGLARLCLLDRLRPMGDGGRRYSAVGLDRD